MGLQYHRHIAAQEISDEIASPSSETTPPPPPVPGRAATATFTASDFRNREAFFDEASGASFDEERGASFASGGDAGGVGAAAGPATFGKTAS